MNDSPTPAELQEIRPRRGNVVALVFLLLAVAAGAVSAFAWSDNPRSFLFSYMTSLMFVTSVSVGALAWLLIVHLTSAVWAVAVRRLLENLTRPLPWIALLFIPFLCNLSRLYIWADPLKVTADRELTRKSIWLNPTAFTVRSVVYFACWVSVAWILSANSMRQDRTGDPVYARRMSATSTWGTIVLGLTSSLAAFDWLMSLSPHWASTIFALYYWAGALVSALAALILLVLVLHAGGLLRQTVTVEHLHDLGKLLFGFVIFWTYIAFCQYFLIWYANFPEETIWYIIRRTGGWNTLSWALVFGHFVVPFILLLPRATKRNSFWLGFVSVWVLVFHYADLYWLIMPALHPNRPEPSWLDASLLLALAFLCGAIVSRACQMRPLVPIGDARLAESVAFHNS